MLPRGYRVARARAPLAKSRGAEIGRYSPPLDAPDAESIYSAATVTRVAFIFATTPGCSRHVVCVTRNARIRLRDWVRAHHIPDSRDPERFTLLSRTNHAHTYEYQGRIIVEPVTHTLSRLSFARLLIRWR